MDGLSRVDISPDWMCYRLLVISTNIAPWKGGRTVAWMRSRQGERRNEMRMRTSALTCAIVLCVAAVGVSSQQRPAAAQTGTLPCTDPRGCPNLTVTKPVLNSSHQETDTF